MSLELGWHYGFVTVMEQVHLRLILQEFFVNEDRKRCNERERLLSASNYPWHGLQCWLEKRTPNNSYNINDYGDREGRLTSIQEKTSMSMGEQIDPEPGDPMH